MRTSLALAALVLALGRPAMAGPPYVTDDAVPTDLGHWEVYTFASGARVDGGAEGAAGLDLNYGAAKDLQLTLVLPAAFDRTDTTSTAFGDVEVAAKFRFFHGGRGLSPDLAFFPRVTLPTAGKGLGEAHPTLLLPLWAEKDTGPWSIFGGGGYRIRPGARDVWIGGVGVTRAISERLTVGGEVYHETADEQGGRDFTGLNLGGAYRFATHWSLLAAAGPGVQNRERGKFNLYVSLRADY